MRSAPAFEHVCWDEKNKTAGALRIGTPLEETRKNILMKLTVRSTGCRFKGNDSQMLKIWVVWTAAMMPVLLGISCKNFPNFRVLLSLVGISVYKMELQVNVFCCCYTRHEK
jgi:hypothetical protein